MFKDKKFLLVFIAQTVLPWIIALSGSVAVYFFNSSSQLYRAKIMDEYERASKICETIYRSTMLYGIGLLLLLFIVGLIAFVMMIINLIGKRREDKYKVIRPLVIWIYSGACIVGTLILMLLVIAFTYGQSV